MSKTKGRATRAIAPQATIEEMCRTFAGAIAALVREQVRQELESVLDPMRAQPVSLGHERNQRTAKPNAGKRAKKRTADQIGAQANQSLSEIKRHGPNGINVEKLGALMGLSTAELALPLKSLIRDGMIKTVGHKRATKYIVTLRGKK